MKKEIVLAPDERAIFEAPCDGVLHFITTEATIRQVEMRKGEEWAVEMFWLSSPDDRFDPPLKEFPDGTYFKKPGVSKGRREPCGVYKFIPGALSPQRWEREK